MTLLETLRSDQSNTTIAKAARDAADELDFMIFELVRFRAALHGIAYMDVLTRDGEKPAHEVMREIALRALTNKSALTAPDRETDNG
jgi:hypothetical protein